MIPARSSTQAFNCDMPAPDGAWRLQRVVVIAILTAMLCQVWLPAFHETTFGIAVDDGTLVVRDMAAHLTFVREFWLGGADYTVESHIRITNEWSGQAVNRALPFGYSPTMLWLLAPLVALPTVWGFAVWTLASGAAVWWMSRRGRTLFVVGALALLGPLSLVCLALGQTGLITAAALVLLMVRHQQLSANDHSERWSWRLAPDVVILWALTAKPPLVLVASVALLAGRRWRTVTAALALTIATTLLLTPKLGADWIGQYLYLLSHYDRETADVAFAWSLRPDHMTNLRSLLWSCGIVGDHAACQISMACWLVAMVGVVTAGITGKLRREVVWPLAAFAYLLFCPHLTSTEDLHLVVLIAALSMSGGSVVTTSKLIAMAFAVAVVFLPPDVFLPAGTFRSGLLFVFKLAAISLIVYERPKSG